MEEARFLDSSGVVERKEQNITVLSLLSTLSRIPVPTHLESHFARVPDPRVEEDNQDSSSSRVRTGPGHQLWQA